MTLDITSELEYISSLVTNAEIDRAAFDNLAEPAIVVDEKRRIVRINRKAELFLEYAKIELLGQVVEILVPESKRRIHAETHVPRYQQFPQSKQMAARFEDLAVVTGGGREIPVRISLEPFIVTGIGRFYNAVLRLKEEIRG